MPSGRRARGLTLLGSLATLLVTVGLASFGLVPWLALFAPVAAIGGVLVWMRRGAEAERAARRPPPPSVPPAPSASSALAPRPPARSPSAAPWRVRPPLHLPPPLLRPSTRTTT